VTTFASTTGTMLDESNRRYIFYRILVKAHFVASGS
jgi:hypothetical protein